MNRDRVTLVRQVQRFPWFQVESCADERLANVWEAGGPFDEMDLRIVLANKVRP